MCCTMGLYKSTVKPCAPCGGTKTSKMELPSSARIIFLSRVYLVYTELLSSSNYRVRGCANNFHHRKGVAVGAAVNFIALKDASKQKKRFFIHTHNFGVGAPVADAYRYPALEAAVSRTGRVGDSSQMITRSQGQVDCDFCSSPRGFGSSALKRSVRCTKPVLK